jgi:lipopolysaccharide transport system ATP-binding protein
MSFNEVAIRVTDLSKRYEIYDRPGDRLKQFIYPKLANLFGKKAGQYFREFWALKDVSFEVKKGETLGIIGRNGAGKSTLLQLICGTLTPTEGCVEVKGRVAALLELGSGFNLEFTGRENVYLNAALLGLSQQEIDSKYQDIVGFADIGDFIDQPVKTYSSGMYVRLAFAVLAHSDAKILIIDEALAVGDAIFIQKCMRFLRKFKEQNTLIFVSHDMSSILNLCERALWLDRGGIRKIGESKLIGEDYLKFSLQEIYGQEVKLEAIDSVDEEENLAIPSIGESVVLDYKSNISVVENINFSKGWKTGAGEIQSVTLEQLTPSPSQTLLGGERVKVVIKARVNIDMERPILGFLVKDRLGQDLFGENTLPFTDRQSYPVSAGSSLVAEYIFRLPMLPNGQYVVMASLAEGDLHNHVQHHWLHDALILNVVSSSVRWGLVGINFESVQLKSNL